MWIYTWLFKAGACAAWHVFPIELEFRSVGFCIVKGGKLKNPVKQQPQPT